MTNKKKNALKERGQYPAIRDQTSLTINDSLNAPKDHFFLGDQRDQSEHRIRLIMLRVVPIFPQG